MADGIIEELWRIKDGIAREYRYDVDALVAHLREEKIPGRSRVEDLRSIVMIAEPNAPADAGTLCSPAARSVP